MHRVQKLLSPTVPSVLTRYIVRCRSKEEATRRLLAPRTPAPKESRSRPDWRRLMAVLPTCVSNVQGAGPVVLKIA